MKLEVGKWYKARNGLRAFIKSKEQIPMFQKYHVNEKGLKTLVNFGDGHDYCIEIATVVYGDDSERRVYADKSRVVNSFLGFDNSYDLIEEWKDDWNEWVDKDQTERRYGKNFVSKSYGIHNVSVISEVGKCVEKIKFNPWDKVRALSGHYCDYTKGSAYNLPRSPGRVSECGDGYIIIDYNGMKSPPVNPDSFELVKDVVTSPIQEKTVKELVPGVYGCVTVGAGYTGELRYSVSPFMNVDQLRAAAKTFNEIADYLDEQK